MTDTVRYSTEALPLEFATATPAAVDNEQVQVLAAHLAAKETATLSAENESLKAELAKLEEATAKIEDLQTKLDVATVELEKEKAAFKEYKETVEREKELATLREARTAAVKEIAASLVEGDGAEDRIDRLARMEEASFTAYLADLKAISGASVSNGFSEGAAESATARGRVPSGEVDSNVALRKTLG